MDPKEEELKDEELFMEEKMMMFNATDKDVDSCYKDLLQMLILFEDLDKITSNNLKQELKNQNKLIKKINKIAKGASPIKRPKHQNDKNTTSEIKKVNG